MRLLSALLLLATACTSFTPAAPGPSAPAPAPAGSVSQIVPQPEVPVAEAAPLQQPVPQPRTAPAAPMPQDACTTGGATDWRSPLPATQVYNPPGQKRIGLQAGHWLTNETPPELRRLQGGSSGGGKAEWEVNLDIAQRAGRMLEAEGFIVDILPTTIPPRYQAHAFISIHADGDTAGRLTGFKIARPSFSSIPATDDRLVGALNDSYARATGLQREDNQISIRMRYYYAFNSRRYCHAVAPGVPQAIVETGFLTSAADRQLLIGNPDPVARGIVNGIIAFLKAPVPS